MTGPDVIWLLVWMYMFVGSMFSIKLGWAIEANRVQIERETSERLGWVSMSMIVVFATLAWPVALVWMGRGRERQ